MNRHAITGIILIRMTLAGFGALPMETRTWTSKEGAVLEAHLLEIKDDQAVLERSDGKVFIIPVNSLISEDQVYVRLAMETIDDSSALPLLRQDPGRNFHAIYTRRNFEARIDNAGKMEIQLLDQHAPVGELIEMKYLIRQESSKPNQFLWRQTSLIKDYGPASRNPSRVSFIAEAVPVSEIKDIPLIQVIFTFENDTICISSEIKYEGEPDVNPASAWAQIIFAPSYGIRDDQDLPTIQQITQAARLKIVRPHSRAGTFTFWESDPRTRGAVERVEVSGPWGARTIQIRVPGDEKRARLGHYPGVPLYSGFHISEEAFYGSNRAELCITIK